MSDADIKNRGHMRARISLVASILLGLVFLISGSGKVIGYGELPGQTMEFLGAVIPGFLFTPAVASFIGNIFLPYIIPWIELCLGIFLILYIWPRFMAIIALLLSIAFMANNAWLISQGVEQFHSCECFGIWEEMFGSLTPMQSMYIDIGLFILVMVIIFIYRNSFFASPAWVYKLQRKKKNTIDS